MSEMWAPTRLMCALNLKTALKKILGATRKVAEKSQFPSPSAMLETHKDYAEDENWLCLRLRPKGWSKLEPSRKIIASGAGVRAWS